MSIDLGRRAFVLPGARRISADGQALRRVATFDARCLAARGTECRICGEACGEAAIRFPPRRGGAPVPQVDADRCTGCGDCLASCPASALRLV